MDGWAFQAANNKVPRQEQDDPVPHAPHASCLTPHASWTAAPLTGAHDACLAHPIIVSYCQAYLPNSTKFGPHEGPALDRREMSSIARDSSATGTNSWAMIPAGRLS
ncbi:hypothetical protein LIA77_06688 [Sarocladium implicatum]|nr:hypothetical protein LIA77_06688 [Sarocladium implicatum]